MREWRKFCDGELILTGTVMANVYQPRKMATSPFILGADTNGLA